jgi:hypothetical protein
LRCQFQFLKTAAAMLALDAPVKQHRVTPSTADLMALQFSTSKHIKWDRSCQHHALAIGSISHTAAESNTDVPVCLAQVMSMLLFAKIALGYPGVVPGRTLLLLAEQHLEGLELGPGVSGRDGGLGALSYAMSALARRNMYKQLNHESAIDLSLRALQYCGARALVLLHACHCACPGLHGCHGTTSLSLRALQYRGALSVEAHFISAGVPGHSSTPRCLSVLGPV